MSSDIVVSSCGVRKHRFELWKDMWNAARMDHRRSDHKSGSTMVMETSLSIGTSGANEEALASLWPPLTLDKRASSQLLGMNVWSCVVYRARDHTSNVAS